MSDAPPPAAPYLRGFYLYVAVRFFSSLAAQIEAVAVGWLVYDITRDPLSLGLIGLAAFAPAIALILVTGPAADRYDRKMILVISSLVMTVAGIGLSFAADGRAVWPIYLLIIAVGAARAFSQPAGAALLPSLVTSEQLGPAVAKTSAAWQVAVIAGPALGGVLYAFGPMVPFIFGALASLISAICALMIKTSPHKKPATRIDWEMIVGGYKYVWSKPVIFGSTTLDLVAVMLGGATALLPIYAREIFHVGPVGLGLLASMPAAGSLTVGALLSWFPLNRKVGHKLFYSVAIYGLATIGFGLSTSMYPALAFLFVLGAADMVSVIVRTTVVQLETPDEMRGRVTAINGIFIGASNQLGEFESGALAAAIGTVPAVVFGGVGAVITAGLWAWMFPALRKRDALH